ncbi:hypothetical protein BH09PSE5_BH09PSE5_19840 [soil metagenome]
MFASIPTASPLVLHLQRIAGKSDTKVATTSTTVTSGLESPTTGSDLTHDVARFPTRTPTRTPTPSRTPSPEPEAFTVAEASGRSRPGQPALVGASTHRQLPKFPRTITTPTDFSHLSYLLSRTIPLGWQGSDIAHFLRETGHPLGALSTSAVRQHSGRYKTDPSYYADGKPAAGWPDRFEKPDLRCKRLEVHETNKLVSLLRKQPDLGFDELLAKASEALPNVAPASVKRWYFSVPRLGHVSTQLKLADARFQTRAANMVHTAKGSEFVSRSTPQRTTHATPAEQPPGNETALDALARAASEARAALLLQAEAKEAPRTLWRPYAHVLEPASEQFI